MGNPLTNAGAFLIHTLFNLAIMIVMLRWLLARRRANYYNPLSQLIIKLTDPLLKPLRQIIPRLESVDLPLVVLLIIVVVVKILLVSLIQLGGLPNIFGFLLWIVAETIKQAVNLIFYLMVIWVVLSWVPSQSVMVISQVLDLVLYPILAPARRYIPAVAGFDFSPLVILLVLQLVHILFVQPLFAFAVQLSFG